MLGGTSLPPASTSLSEDRFILQKHQHRAANLHPPGQTPAGERDGDPRPGSLPGWQGWGFPQLNPPPYPLGRKLLCQMVEMPVRACRARSITNTSASTEPTACRWVPRARCGGMARGHPCPGVTLGAIPMPPSAVIHTLLTPQLLHPTLAPPT